MLYPNNIKKSINKSNTTHANRGMILEYLIEQANEYYILNDIAYIYKKPTPIGIVNVNYINGYKRITDAYYKMPSTLDFNGLYKGYYIEFDAKETKSNTSFPISNVHEHQIKHIRNINNNGGIVFLIISMNDKFFLLPGSIFIDFVDNEKRKSISYEYLKNNAYEITYGLNGLDYIKVIDKMIGDKYEKD